MHRENTEGGGEAAVLRFGGDVKMYMELARSSNCVHSIQMVYIHRSNDAQCEALLATVYKVTEH